MGRTFLPDTDKDARRGSMNKLRTPLEESAVCDKIILEEKIH